MNDMPNNFVPLPIADSSQSLSRGLMLQQNLGTPSSHGSYTNERVLLKFPCEYCFISGKLVRYAVFSNTLGWVILVRTGVSLRSMFAEKLGMSRWSWYAEYTSLVCFGSGIQASLISTVEKIPWDRSTMHITVDSFGGKKFTNYVKAARFGGKAMMYIHNFAFPITSRKTSNTVRQHAERFALGENIKLPNPVGSVLSMQLHH